MPADSVDVVISNCVINLSVDKAKVLTEIARVLQTGGRIGISDVVADNELTPDGAGRTREFRRMHRRGRCRPGRVRGRARRLRLRRDYRSSSLHEVADGMHGAIIRAVKTSEPEARGLP